MITSRTYHASAADSGLFHFRHPDRSRKGSSYLNSGDETATATEATEAQRVGIAPQRGLNYSMLPRRWVRDHLAIEPSKEATR